MPIGTLYITNSWYLLYVLLEYLCGGVYNLLVHSR